jgi:ribosomal-protein-alanine N-acetyltransferase
MSIETERLGIRHLGPGDEAFVLELLNEPDFLKNIGDRHVRNLEDATAYLIKGPIASYEKFGFGLFHVGLKESGTSIGICGLLKRDSLEDVDIGFAYLERYRGRGYALEAAQAVMSFGWNLGLRRIVAITAAHNEASMRVLRKLGMELECTGETNVFGKNI